MTFKRNEVIQKYLFIAIVATRLLGVLGRHADDLNRTFPSRQQPAPQVLPSNTPNPFNPSPDNLTPHHSTSQNHSPDK